MVTSAVHTCFLCEVPLVDDAVSLEHIIPNALGGRLKSRALLCDTDNKGTSKIDAGLIEPLHRLANAIGFERERGKTPRVVVELDGGERYRRAYDGHLWPLPARPSVTEGEGQLTFDITASNTHEVRKHLEGLKRKYPKLDVEAHMADVKETVEYVRKQMTFELGDLGESEMYRAVVKIAVSYYMHLGGGREHVRECIDVIRNTDMPALERVGCLYSIDPLPQRTDAITNVLAIVSDEQGHLCAYVELLRAIRFVVRLSDTYAGAPIRAVYVHDVLARRELLVDPAALIGLPWTPEGWDREALERELDAVMRIIEPREMPQPKA